MAMQSAGVAQLKAGLSEYLTRVRAGGEVLVTDHGRPIAKLVPVEPSALGEEEEERRLKELERAGVLRVGRAALPASFWEEEGPPDPEASVRGALIEERRTGR